MNPNRSNTYGLGRHKKINPLVSDEEDDMKDLEFEDTRLETPKSSRYSTQRTTIKVPLKSGDEQSQRITTPTVMERLTKYKSRNGTPLRTSSKRKSTGPSDPMIASSPKEADPNIIDREREDTLIKQRKLISDDNKFSPNDTSVKLFKTSDFSHTAPHVPTTHSSPTRVHSRSFNDVDPKIQSPPSNFRIRPLNFDKLNQDKELGKNRRLFLDDQELKKTIPSALPSQASISGNVDDGLEEKIRETPPKAARQNDIEFDSSDDENSERASIKPQINGESNKYASPQQRPVDHPVHSVDQAVHGDHDPQIPTSIGLRTTDPSEDHAHNLNNLASSVEIDSVSTNGIGLDKGSLNVGIPSRVDIDPQNDMQRLETLERINVTMGANGTTRLSFNEKPRNHRNMEPVNDIPINNKPISEMDQMNKINAAMDLESDISSDDNPMELLNELNSFLPNRSSPAKKSGRSPPNRFSNGSKYSKGTGVNGSKYSRGTGVNGSTKYKNIPVPEMTPIRKHYSRLSDKYAKHIMNKKQRDPEVTGGKEMESYTSNEQDSSVDLDEPWTGTQWYKLNKVITSDTLSVEDIINSEVLVRRLGCKSKTDLKQRVKFLIKFNEHKKLERKA